MMNIEQYFSKKTTDFDLSELTVYYNTFYPNVKNSLKKRVIMMNNIKKYSFLYKNLIPYYLNIFLLMFNSYNAIYIGILLNLLALIIFGILLEKSVRNKILNKENS